MRSPYIINIVILYKNKGDGSDCNIYNDILLLGVVGKIIACMVFRKLQILSDLSHGVTSDLVVPL